MTPNTKYAQFIDQAEEGLEQAIKARTRTGGDASGEEVPPLVQLLRKLLEGEDDADDKTE